MFFRVVSNEKNNVCACRLVVLRHFISENMEIITSNKKLGFQKANILSFFSPFNEMQFLLPLRGPFPAQLSSWVQGRFSSSNLLQPDSPVAGPVCFSGDLMSSSLPGFSLFPFVPPRKSDLLGVSGVAES